MQNVDGDMCQWHSYRSLDPGPVDQSRAAAASLGERICSPKATANALDNCSTTASIIAGESEMSKARWDSI